MVQLLDGKKVSQNILHELKLALEFANISPKLSIVLCGDDPASVMYTSMKQKKALEIGLKAEIHLLAKNTTEKDFIDKLAILNRESDGIIVQLPLPKHLNEQKILNSIDPNKDVDGLTEASLGKVAQGNEDLAPATPKGIIRLLEEYDINLQGMEVTIINRSSIVGKPLALMFLNRGATVTICHSQTKNLLKHTQNADLIVAAVGKPNFLTADMVKNGVIIVDVGANKTKDGLKGDVDFEKVKEKASLITAVPGGVGPMTVAMLLENVVNLASKNL